MNKALKITLISLGSFLGLILLTIAVVCWFVVTPARLTSIVKNQAPNFINCDFNIEKADLTIFKSFPKVGLEINDVVLMNQMVGSPSDTLAYIDECVVSVDVKKFLNEKHILIDECRLSGGYVNLFIDEQGNSNLDIFPPSEPDTIDESEEFTYGIDLALLKFNDVDVNYADLSVGIIADINGFNMAAKGKMKDDLLAGNMNMSMNELVYQQVTDSLSMAVKLNNLKAEGEAEMLGDNVKADIDVSSSDLLYESEGQIAGLQSLSFKYKGDVNNYDNVNGNVEMYVNDLSFTMDDVTLVNEADLRFISPLNATLSTMDVEFGNSQLALNNMFIDFIGKASMPGDDIVVDLDLKTNTLIIKELIELIPASMREELLAGIDVDGELNISAKVDGVYNETSMPQVDAEITYNNGMLAMPEMLPYPITNLNTSIKAEIDLNDKSDIYLNSFNANMSKSSVAVSGTIKDVMDNMYCDINLKANADLDELQSFMPEGIAATGKVRINGNAKVNSHQLTTMDFMKAKVNGNMQWENMNVVYCDTITVNSDKLNIDLTLPNTASKDLTNSLAALEISGANFDAKVSDMIVANLKDYKIDAQISNIMDEKEPMSVFADYSFSRIDAAMDDMVFYTNNPKGTLAMFMKENNDASYIAVYSGDSLSFNMGEEMSFVTENLDFNVSANYDDDQEDLLLQWNPHAGIQLNKAVFAMSDLPTPVYIPSIDFNYDTTGIQINNSSIVLGNSDFELEGKFTNVDEFIKKEALLKGNLDFTSHYTDVNEIMDIFSGMGDTTVVAEEVVVTDTIEEEQEPFMVPLGIDITLNTKIEKAIAGDMDIANIGGGLTVKDGILVLNEMGFTSDAATMMLTAMYKSSRRNHLYLGFDFHLLEIDIAEMINIIPELDTLVPMLSSFAGKAEFHIAAETYLNSKYEMKVSTLRGATAIHGKDLVVLDNATFRKIARMLNFKDKEHNRIDELSVEITAFKSEIDVYPTLIALDKYQAIVGGRHKLDMTFDYSLGISNPWPFRRLGIKIGGNLDDMKFGFRLKKNLKLDDPKGKEKDVHLIEETLRLKKIIYESLNANVKK
jgi:hypothetical protein